MNKILKIMLLGDTSTGKTSFLTKLMFQNADSMPKTTEELSFFTMHISKSNSIVQIWDSPGQPQYQYQSISILNSFHTILIFIDCTNQHTLIRASIIINQISLYKHLKIHLIQTKGDIVQKLPYKRKVRIEDLQKLMEANGGGKVFHYNPKVQVDQIIQQIVNWHRIPPRNPPLPPSSHVRQDQNHKNHESQPSCDCYIF